MDEIGLIQAAKQGDLDAFNRLVLAYQDMVYNQAYRMIGDEAAASDATQEAFISAYRNIKGFRGGIFKAWLLRIVTNACYDELRRRARRPTTSLEPLDDTGDEIESPVWMKDSGELPDETVERAELERAIMACLNGLSPEFRAAVVLVDVQGLDYDQAAISMSSPVGTVKSRLARARSRLRDCLQTFWELLPAEFRLRLES
jgi:RNA polymerase sigma-70 factor (ECF subfamily)